MNRDLFQRRIDLSKKDLRQPSSGAPAFLLSVFVGSWLGAIHRYEAEWGKEGDIL
jgi:hypothetical protein